MRRLLIAVAVAACALVTPLAAPAAADGSWIDGPRVNWNQAGMSVPTAPAMDAAVDPRCFELRRRPETYEDKVVAAAGWTL